MGIEVRRRHTDARNRIDGQAKRCYSPDMRPYDPEAERAFARFCRQRSSADRTAAVMTITALRFGNLTRRGKIQPSDVISLLQDLGVSSSNSSFKDLPEFPFLNEIAGKLSPSSLGRIFERAAEAAEIKKQGAVFTPEWLARRMSHAVLNPADHTETILDPSVGGGVFALAAFEELTSRGIEPMQAIERIYAVDRNEYAVAVSRTALLVRLHEVSGTATKAARSAVWRRIIKADALIDRSSLSPGEVGSVTDLPLINWSERFPEIAAAGGFGVVIGNPPYGLSRGARMSSVEKKILERLYAGSRSGKINSYLLFMARALDLLRPGGQMSFIVPNSWLGISAGAAMRRRLMSEGAIKRITVYDEPVFDDPSVEVVTLEARKGAPGREIVICQSAPGKQPHKTCRVPVSRCLALADCSIPLAWDSQIERFVDAMLKRSFPLGAPQSCYRPMIALQAYARGRGFPPQSEEDVSTHPFHQTIPAADAHPYLEGKDVRRYSIDWSGRYLRYGPWLAEPQSLDRFTGPRIVLREILAPAPHRISAAFIESIALYNKSVLHILPQGAAGRAHMLALLGVLNSSVMSAFISLRGRKSQRNLFPKLVNGDLKALPVPAALLRDPEPLAALVEERITASSGFEALESRIERAVRKMYGVLDVVQPVLPGHRPASTIQMMPPAIQSPAAKRLRKSFS